MNTDKLYLHLMFDKPLGPGARLVDARIETDENPTVHGQDAGRYHATLLHAEHGNPHHYEPGDRTLEQAEEALLLKAQKISTQLMACPSLAALVRSRQNPPRGPLVGQAKRAR